MCKNETSFKIGNKASEKWTREEMHSIFEKMKSNAQIDNDILCLQDAIASVNLYTSSINYFTEKYPDFEKEKKDIQDIIVSRINKGCLKGEFNATGSIWRMKQLGEKESQNIDHTTGGEKINIISLGEGKKPDEVI